jgi:hypothetical protein
LPRQATRVNRTKRSLQINSGGEGGRSRTRENVFRWPASAWPRYPRRPLRRGRAPVALPADF